MSQMAIKLALLLAVSELLYVDLLMLDAVNGWRPVGRFLLDMALLFGFYSVAWRVIAAGRSRRHDLALVFAGALLFRGTLLPAGMRDPYRTSNLAAGLSADLLGREVTFEPFLLFDSDVWRYLWEGHAAAHGANPFRQSPNRLEMSPLAAAEPGPATDHISIWPEIHGNVTHRELTSVYPPAAHALFRLSHYLAPASVTMIKLLVTALDLAVAVLLVFSLRALGLPESYVVLYAWNPLVVKVFAGSAHYDALVLALLAGATLAVIHRRIGMASAVLGLSVLAKLAPAVLFPFLVRRAGWSALLPGAVPILVGLAIMLQGSSNFSGFAAFAQSWRFNGGPYLLLDSATGPAARYLAAGLLMLALWWLFRRDSGTNTAFLTASANALGASLLLSPVVNPWYVTWILPFAAPARRWLWLLFSALVCLSFLVMVDGREHHWVLWVEYGLMIPAAFWLRRKRGNLCKTTRKEDSV